jgi:hypothetical protein
LYKNEQPAFEIHYCSDPFRSNERFEVTLFLYHSVQFFSFTVLTLFVSLMPLVQSFFIIWPIFGPDTPEAIFKGKITENGHPVPAHLSLEVLYKANGEEIPLSLM